MTKPPKVRKHFPEGTPFETVLIWMRAHFLEGFLCPACGQNVAPYKDQVVSTQAKAMIVLWDHHGRDWGHLPTLRAVLAPHHSNSEPKLRWWGLLEEDLDPDNRKKEDGSREGYWRITQRGEDWLRGKITIPKHAFMYNTKLLKLDGPPVSISDALHTPFDLRDTRVWPEEL